MRLIGGYNENAKAKPLHDYQCRAVDFVLDRLYTEDEAGAGLFLDPGLGKTRTSLTIIDLLLQMGAIEKALILAPLRPLYSVWPNELREWGFPYLSAMLHKQLDKGLVMDRPIELMNFGSVKKLAEYKNRWDIIIVDESTYLKNWSAKRTGFVKKMIKTIPKRIILTGTPAANSLQDLFSQLFIVDNGESLGRTITKFRGLYCQPSGWQGRQWAIKGGSVDLLEARISDRCLRMQCEDYLDMPDLIQNNVYVDLPTKVKGQYKRFEKELVAEIEAAEAETAKYEADLEKWANQVQTAPGLTTATPMEKPARPMSTIYSPNASGAYMKCRQLAAGMVYLIDEDGRRMKNKTPVGYEYGKAHAAKLEALMEIAEGINGKPLMIGYNFKHELAEILKMIGKTGVGVIQGGMKESDVNPIIDKWNGNKLRFLVCQWRAASHGLNLQKSECGDIAAFSLTDSPETYEQLYRRIYRQGSGTKQVRIHRILTRDTVDMVQCERVDGKLTTQKDFLEALKQHAKKNTQRKKKS
jgi:SNF2 family DNA or RNA helicase